MRLSQGQGGQYTDSDRATRAGCILCTLLESLLPPMHHIITPARCAQGPRYQLCGACLLWAGTGPCRTPQCRRDTEKAAVSVVSKRYQSSLGLVEAAVLVALAQQLWHLRNIRAAPACEGAPQYGRRARGGYSPCTLTARVGAHRARALSGLVMGPFPATPSPLPFHQVLCST